MEERARVMNQPIDTSAKNFALKAELEKSEKSITRRATSYVSRY